MPLTRLLRKRHVLVDLHRCYCRREVVILSEAKNLDTPDRDWPILFIGGTSATGKSTLAHDLARRFDASHVDLGLIWIVLQRALPADVEPALHLFQPDTTWLLPVDELVDRYLRIATYICRVIEPIVAHQDIIGVPAVIERAWLLPSFATRDTYAQRGVIGARCLFLNESFPDESSGA